MFCDKCGTKSIEGAVYCIKCGAKFKKDKSRQSKYDTLDKRDTSFAIKKDIILGNRYKILERLGSGGMGVVYRAEDMKVGLIVALKILPPELSEDARAVKKLKEEARVAMSLSHPNIVHFYHFEETPKAKFVTMKYVKGDTLMKLLGEKGKFTLSEMIEYAKQICEGLEYAHQRGIIHRDIKPSNIILDEYGVIKIADFGIARIIKDTMTKITSLATAGTLVYMSPEQLLGIDVSEKSDVYALGVMLYEFLSGKPPFDSGDITYQHINVTPPPIRSVPKSINNVILKALEKKKERRWKDIAEFSHELQRAYLTQKIKMRATKGLLVPAILLLTIFFVDYDESKLKPEQPLQATMTDYAETNGNTEPTSDNAISTDNVPAIGALMQMADSLFELDEFITADTSNALYMYRKVVALDPSNTRAQERIFKIIEELRTPVKLAKFSEPANASKQQSPNQSQGSIQSVNNLDKDTFDAVKENMINIYLKEGMTQYDNKQYEESIITLTRVLLLDPENSEANQYIGNARAIIMGVDGNKKNADDDIVTEEASPEINDMSEEYINKGTEAYENGDYVLAKEFLEQALAISPGNTRALNLLSLPELMSSKEPNDAETYYLEAIDYLRKGNYAEADSLGRLAIDLEPDYEVRIQNAKEDLWQTAFSEGESYFKNGDLDKAREYFKQSTLLDPTNKLGHIYLGLTAFTLNEYQESIEANKNALRIDKSDMTATLNLGAAYLKAGENDLAIAAYRHCLKIDENNQIALQNLTLLYIDKGDNTKAGETFETLLLNHDVPLTDVYDLSVAFYNSRGFDNAAVGFEVVLGEDNSNVDAMKFLDVIYAKLKEYEKVIPILERLVDLEPDNLSAWENLKKALSKTDGNDGKLEEATKKIEELKGLANES